MVKLKKMLDDYNTNKTAKKYGRTYEQQKYRNNLAKSLKDMKSHWNTWKELEVVLSQEQWRVEYADAFTANWRKMDNEMAKKLIEYWNRKWVKENLTKFKSLDDDVIKILWNEGRKYYLQRIYDEIKKDTFEFLWEDVLKDVFNYITPNELADMLIYIGNDRTRPYWQGDILAQNFEMFYWLDPLEYAKKLEEDYGNKYYFSARRTGGSELRNPISDLIRNCKTITPEFENYILSLTPNDSSFKHQLEDRKKHRPTANTLVIKRKSKDELLAEFIKKSKDVIWKTEKWEK